MRSSKFASALFGATALVLVPCVASAQDRVQDRYPDRSDRQAASWTGAHIGASFGVAWSTLDIDYAATPVSGGGFSALGAANIIAAGTGSIKSSGVIAGGQAGYDRQWDHLVLGGELDLSYTDLSGSRTAPVFGVPNNLSQSFASHFFATVRGRAGYAQGPWLIYATGGLALADVSVGDTAVSSSVGTAQSSTHELRAGWTVGGGVERMLAKGWSVKAEYLHADLGTLTDQHVFPGAPLAVSTHDHRLTEDVARIGLNYRLR